MSRNAFHVPADEFIELGVEFDVDLDSECDTVSLAISSPTRRGPVPKKRLQELEPRIKNGRWIIQPWIDDPRPDDPFYRSRKTINLGPATMSLLAARRARDPIRMKINASVPPRTKLGATINDFAAEWLSQVVTHKAPGAQRPMKSHFNTHLNPHLGKLQLTQLSTKAVQEMITAMKSKWKTTRNVLSTLKNLHRAAKVLGYEPGHIDWDGLILPKRGAEEEADVLTAEEMFRIAEAANEPYGTMFHVLRLSGIRGQELRGLKVEDLDFKDKRIRIRRSLDIRTRQEQDTKAPSSRADITMPSELERRLQAFLNNHWRKNPKGFLFVNRNGNPYAHAKIVEYGLWPVQDRCGTKRTGLHAFRHGVGEALARDGVPLKDIQRQLRHADVKTTLRYLHSNELNLREAMERQGQLESKAPIGVKKHRK